MKKLYKHQGKQNKLAKKALKEHDHILYGASTGFGKSVAMYHMVKNDLKGGKRVLVLAPRRSLIFQLEQTFATYEPHVLLGTIDRGSRTSGLVVSSIQTTNARLKKQSKDFEGFDVIYIDEAHLGCQFPPRKGSQFQLLYEKYWDSAKWIGLTATPITAQGYRLEGWDETIYKYQTAKLIKMGYLADYEYYAPANMDTSSMSLDSSGDYKIADIDEVVTQATAIKSVKREWKKFKKKSKILIFASSIQHAELLQESLKGSAIIHSKQPEKMQQDVLFNFKIQKSATLINVGMLTTGFDDPSVDVLLIARPIKSVRLAMQVWGRALRLYGDKVSTILDMGNVYEDCGLPKDIRDFNRVKKVMDKKKSDEIVEAPVIKCPDCKQVSLRTDCDIDKKTTKKFILTKIYCPVCGSLADEQRKDLNNTDELKRIDEVKVKKLSYKERKAIIVPMVKEFTNANEKWSHFIVTKINTDGNGEVFDSIVARPVTDKTKWKHIMEVYNG